MRNPPHPGSIVRRQCLDPLDLSVTEAAKGLGVTRQALSDLLNGKAGISIEMAIRLSKAFGSSPETWLGMQMAHGLWQAREHVRSLGLRGVIEQLKRPARLTIPIFAIQREQFISCQMHGYPCACGPPGEGAFPPVCQSPAALNVARKAFED
jgi:addiction module HigA family antidote